VLLHKFIDGLDVNTATCCCRPISVNIHMLAVVLI